MSLASSLSCGPVHGLLERPLGLTPFFFFFFLIISIFFFFFTHSLLISCPLASQGRAWDWGSPRGLTD